MASRADTSQGGWSDPGTAAPAPVRPVEGPRYRLDGVLGHGGMGVVHAARDRTLGREVALKALPPDRADAGAAQRLAREAAITSRLDHPGIVAVYDVGADAEGRPYYTMRLVRGDCLARRMEQTPAPRPQLLRPLLAACEAVAAAHDAGIVHRDLKPENILVGPHGEIQVIDWGLAAPTPAAAARWGDLPGNPARGRVGTEAYMAPEQARGDDPDPRHDVWSLGVCLREVLGELGPELAAVAARATAPFPERYPDAGALAADLAAYFEGRRVAVHTYSLGELAWRAFRAWRAPILAGAVGLLAVAVAVAWGWWETRAALTRALAAEADAQARLADVRVEQAAEATRAGRREEAERLAAAVLAQRDDPVARGVIASFGRADHPVRLRDVAAPACGWAALPPGAAWMLCGNDESFARYDASEAGWQERWRVVEAAEGAELHPDVAVVHGRSRRRVVVDLLTGAVRSRVPEPQTDWQRNAGPASLWAGEGFYDVRGKPPSGCFGRMPVGELVGDRLTMLCDDGTLLLGTADAPGERRVATGITGEQVATAMAALSDGWLIGSVRGRIFRVRSDGTVLSQGDTDLGVVRRIVVAPDGRHAALLGSAGRVGLWRVDNASLVADLGEGVAAAFATDGVVVLGERLTTWRLPRGAPAVVRAPAGLADVAASPDGRRLAIAGGAGHGAVVDLLDGTTTVLRLGDRVVKTAAFGATDVIFTGMDAPFVRGLGTAFVAGRPLRRLAAFADGAVVGVDMDDGLYRWKRPDHPPEKFAAGHTFVDLERDGERLVLLDGEGEVYTFSGETLTPLRSAAGARAVALHGDRLWTSHPDGIHGANEIPVEGTLDLSVSSDGARIAAAGIDGHVRVYSTGDGALLADLPGHRERAAAVEFLPDGDLASASWDGTARVADLSVLSVPAAELARRVEAAW